MLADGAERAGGVYPFRGGSGAETWGEREGERDRLLG